MYDYDTSVINGSYQLYGSRPHWMKVGSVIDLEGVGSLEIVSSIYDEDVNKEVIEKNLITLIKGLRIHNLPFIVNEQYKKGIGETIPALKGVDE
mgnify:CR=1 FL=1